MSKFIIKLKIRKNFDFRRKNKTRKLKNDLIELKLICKMQNVKNRLQIRRIMKK